MSSTTAETRPFQAEVSQILDLVVNSLYSHKEIFLRELVSNASDALGKLQFRALTDEALRGSDHRPGISILPDRKARTLTVADNGIGMTREEMIEDLGTIARSGSKSFLERMAESSKGGEGGLDLIGQFGVGFYSSFLVADRVEVVSRAAGSEEAHRWTSDARDSFTIEPAERAHHGTTVTLHLAEEQDEYLEEHRLRTLIKRYSDFVDFPIQLSVEKDGKSELQTVNQARALWRRSKDEITDEEYDEFYKHLTQDFEGPLARSHFKVEGVHEFTGLVYIPARPPFDLYLRDAPRGIRLFVQRIFIMDDCEEILPIWLRFVRGVVDSGDLPLNVSREILQDSRVTRTIQKTLTRKVLELLAEVQKDRPEDYRKFWTAFGPVLKEGLHLDPSSRERLLDLLLFASSAGDEPTTLADYAERMAEGQEKIYYIAGPSRTAVEKSPHLEALRARGYEVLFMTDPVDEFAIQGIGSYRDKPLVSALTADLGFEKTDEEKERHGERQTALRGLVDRIRAILQDRVQEVRLSTRLTDSPACLVVPEGGMGAHMERLLRAMDRDVPETKRILEIHPDHPVIERMRLLEEQDPKSPDLAEWVEVLHDQALLTEGSPLPDPNLFSARVTRLLARAMGAEGAAAGEGS